MASAISNRIQSHVQSISDKLNAISNNALLRCVSNFRRAHPLLFWLFSPMIVPAASCLVFLSSIILSGIVFLAIFYGILFLLFLPTLLVVLSGPTMLVVCIICTCYICYQGFLFVQRCVRIVKRAPQIARQFYTSTLERVVWFLAMENGNPFTNQQWITLWNEFGDKIVAIYRLIVSIITTTYRIVSFMVSILNQVWTFFSEKSPKERLEDQVRAIERKMEQIIDRVEGRITRVIQKTRNTYIIM